MRCKTCRLISDGPIYCPRCGSISVSGLELAFASGCLLLMGLGLFVFVRIVISHLFGN